MYCVAGGSPECKCQPKQWLALAPSGPPLRPLQENDMVLQAMPYLDDSCMQNAGILLKIQQCLEFLSLISPVQRWQQHFLIAILGFVAPSCDLPPESDYTLQVQLPVCPIGLQPCFAPITQVSFAAS